MRERRLDETVRFVGLFGRLRPWLRHESGVNPGRGSNEIASHFIFLSVWSAEPREEADGPRWDRLKCWGRGHCCEVCVWSAELAGMAGGQGGAGESQVFLLFIYGCRM